MNSNFIKNSNLKSASIQQVNDALIVLRHFIHLNSKILPLLHALSKRNNPKEKDHDHIFKIRNVFESYQFDQNASVILIDSPILEMISKAYNAIVKNPRDAKSEKRMQQFLLEYNRLKSKWDDINRN